MLNFDFLEKGLEIVSQSHEYFSYYILLTDQILLPDCLNFLSENR